MSKQIGIIAQTNAELLVVINRLPFDIRLPLFTLLERQQIAIRKILNNELNEPDAGKGATVGE